MTDGPCGSTAALTGSPSGTDRARPGRRSRRPDRTGHPRLARPTRVLRPEMMVFVDADVAFRRALELDARRSRRDLVDVEAAGLLDRQLPQPRAEIGGLRHVADHGLLAPHLLERRDEGLVVRIVERLEVLHAGIGAGDVLAADAVDFVFGHRDRQQRLLRQVDAGRLELLVERDVRSADDDRRRSRPAWSA